MITDDIIEYCKKRPTREGCDFRIKYKGCFFRGKSPKEWHGIRQKVKQLKMINNIGRRI